jgi:phosphoribosylformylglycinamidine cyclo-ligase
MITYRQSGVDIAAGNSLVEQLKPLVASSFDNQVLKGIGSFAAFYALPAQKMQQPVLVSSCDGVGTKVKLALEAGDCRGLGQDLLAMSVNDLLVHGATPLFFLDYYATGRLVVENALIVIGGLAKACREYGVALIGGETAEMPGVYHGEDIDLAGFCLGIVDRQNIIDGNGVQVGDIVIGLASSGPHANGFSLIRRLLAEHSTPPTLSDGRTVREVCLTPTHIYRRAVESLINALPVQAFAHITGGGLLENIPRVLPEGMAVSLDRKCWPQPEVFTWLKQAGDLDDQEFYRTFNAGIGMIAIVSPQDIVKALSVLDSLGEKAWEIGVVVQQANDVRVVII